MTKPKATKTSADAKAGAAKKTGGKAKAAAEAAKPKKTKAAAKAASTTQKPAKEKAKEKTPAGTSAAAAKPAREKKKSSDTEVIANPAPAAADAAVPVGASAAGFANSGLGIKIASRKPALSVAPGVMILGRSAQSKPEQAHKQSDRRLSRKEQADIKNFLLERRERLLAGMRRELAMQKERAESKAADEVDKATDAYDEDLSFEIATANDQELEEIQVALEKIEKGTYGECEVCGCGISPSRLKILPSAITCVSCRGQEEMARRRNDGAPAFNIITGEDSEIDADPM